MKKMLKNIMIALVVASQIVACQSSSSQQDHSSQLASVSPSETVVFPEKNVEVAASGELPGFKRIDMVASQMINDMVYSTTKNFTGQQIYPCPECYLRAEVADGLQKANEVALKKKYRLIIFDCYRPMSLQQKMYDIVKNPAYVAEPGKGSKHNRGCAVDVGLADASGKPLEMGSAFDEFSEKSHYSNVESGSEAAIHRKELRDIMTEAGFLPYEKEWWHFNFKNTNYETSDLVWPCQ